MQPALVVQLIAEHGNHIEIVGGLAVEQLDFKAEGEECSFERQLLKRIPANGHVACQVSLADELIGGHDAPLVHDIAELEDVVSHCVEQALADLMQERRPRHGGCPLSPHQRIACQVAYRVACPHIVAGVESCQYGYILGVGVATEQQHVCGHGDDIHCHPFPLAEAFDLRVGKVQVVGFAHGFCVAFRGRHRTHQLLLVERPEEPVACFGEGFTFALVTLLGGHLAERPVFFLDGQVSVGTVYVAVEDLPRSAVENDMVHVDKEIVRPFDIEQPDSEQPLAEHIVGLDEPSPLGFEFRNAQVFSRQVESFLDSLLPRLAAVGHQQAGVERFVTADCLLDGFFQSLDIHLLGDTIQGRNIGNGLPAVFQTGKKVALLHFVERIVVHHGLDLGLHLAEHLGHAARRGTLVDDGGGDGVQLLDVAVGAHLLHGHHLNAVAAQLAEVVVDAHARQLHHLCHDVAQGGLHLVTRRCIFGGELRPLGRLQRFAVNLAVGVEGEPLHRHKERRHHIRRQLLLQDLPHLLTLHFYLFTLNCIVAHQILAAAAGVEEAFHHGAADALDAADGGFHLAGLDALAVDLHHPVLAVDELYAPVGQQASQVVGVEPSAPVELQGALLVLEVALAEVALEAYLAVLALRHGAQVVVEQGHLHAGDGQADGGVLGGLVDAGVDDGTHRLAEAIGVLDAVGGPLAAYHAVAAGDDDTYGRSLAAVHREDRGTDEGDGDAVVAVVLGHAHDVLVDVGRHEMHLGAEEQLPVVDGGDEVGGYAAGEAVVGREAVGVEHPQSVDGQRAVVVQDALGRSCRPRGVDQQGVVRLVGNLHLSHHSHRSHRSHCSHQLLINVHHRFAMLANKSLAFLRECGPHRHRHAAGHPHAHLAGQKLHPGGQLEGDERLGRDALVVDEGRHLASPLHEGVERGAAFRPAVGPVHHGGLQPVGLHRFNESVYYL